MKYLTVKKLAEEKSIPASAIRSFIKTGLPHYRPGSKKILISKDEFDQWFTDNFRVEAEPCSDEIGQIVEETLVGIV
jgi:excisionase family DNA binding protein